MMDILSLKDVFKIKLKTRYDGFCEQYQRIFMMKALLMATMILGLNWYTDKVGYCFVIKTIFPRNLCLKMYQEF